MGKVLVKKANGDTGNIGVTYPVGAGAPVMVLGGGGGSGRGKTLRQRAGGALGGLVGVAGALTGQHRSLGGLTQSMISGGAQGRQLGEALGRFASGRDSRARAKLRQSVADKYADAKASGEFDRYGVDSGRTAFTRFGQGRMSQNLYDLEQAKQAEKNAMAEARAKAMEDARAFGADEGGRRRRMAEYADRIADGMSVDEFGEKVGVYESMRNQAQAQRAQQTPPTALQLGLVPPMPPSDVKLTAAGELGQQVRPEDVDTDTEGEVSDNMPPTPQSNNPSQLTPSNQVAVQNMNNPQQIRAARQKVEDREEMME